MAVETASRDVHQYTETISLDHIAVSGNNPREEVEDEDFAGLKADLAANGLINPIMVRPVGNPDSSRYEVVCGHRRLEAARQLGWPSIRCTVRAVTDEEAFDLMGVENIQRRSFAPIEELAWLSKAIQNAEARGEKQKDFAARIGRTPSWVSNKLRVAKAPQELLDLYTEGKLQDKHVLVLLTYHPYPKLYDELMEVIHNTLEDGGNISASEIEEEAAFIIRVGGEQRLALCVDPLPYEFKDLQPYWPQDGSCPGRKCGKVKIIESDGKSYPFCLDKECWEQKIKEAQDRKFQADSMAYSEEQEAIAAVDQEKDAQRQAEDLARGHKCVVEGCDNFAGKGNTFCSEHGPNDMNQGGQEGRVQKCHVASCTRDTLPGKFWCEEHLTPESREMGTESAPSADKPEESPENEEEMEAQSEVLPVNPGGPAKVCQCKICGGEIVVKDRAQAIRDMVEHLLLNRDKERHNRAIQKFVSGLLNNEGLARLEAYFDLPKEEQPEIYHECRPKDRGVMAKSIEQARTILECDKCKNHKCKGPEVE